MPSWVLGGLAFPLVRHSLPHPPHPHTLGGGSQGPHSSPVDGPPPPRRPRPGGGGHGSGIRRTLALRPLRGLSAKNQAPPNPPFPPPSTGSVPPLCQRRRAFPAGPLRGTLGKALPMTYLESRMAFCTKSSHWPVAKAWLFTTSTRERRAPVIPSTAWRSSTNSLRRASRS